MKKKIKIDPCLIDPAGNVLPEIIPNADLMADAIKSEALFANKENRLCKTSLVIEEFRSVMDPAISEKQVNALFDFVFDSYRKTTGANIITFE